MNTQNYTPTHETLLSTSRGRSAIAWNMVSMQPVGARRFAHTAEQITAGRYAQIAADIDKN